PLFKATTETPAPGEIRPSKALVRVVLGAVDKRDVELLDECLAEKGLKPGDYASLLRAIKVPAGAGHNLWFGRPALQPFCPALSGAHAFQYFWIEEQRSGAQPQYRIRFQNGGDAFAVYPQRSHGLNDIEATGCIASGCRIARLSFDGREYRTVRCSRSTWEDDREVIKPRRCGSDDGRDDQASGFVPDD